MNITAINKLTGKIILSHSGTIPTESFKKTVKSMFPSLEDDEILIIGEEKNPSTNKKSLIWQGSFFDLGGYAGMNREIVFRLIKRGLVVKPIILKTAPQADPETISRLNALASIKLPDESRCPIVVGFTPMQINGRGRKVIFFTMMETQGVHQTFIERCNRYANEVWVPCKFYLDAFKKSGLIKPLHLIPLGVDETLYHPNAIEPHLIYEEMPSGNKTDKLPNSFRFISLFGWSYRKGPDILCLSYLKEFSHLDDVCLVIYSRYMGGSGEPQKEHVRHQIRVWMKESGKEKPPKIFYCGDEIPIKNLPGCYAAANAFVFCSRGEGFGLPVCEAGACGIPVISTYNTAMTEYLDEDVASLVKCEEYASANEQLTWITEFYRDQLFPVLGEKQIEEFGTHMRKAYNNNPEISKKAQNFRKRILEKYTWDHCANTVAAKLTGK